MKSNKQLLAYISVIESAISDAINLTDMVIDDDSSSATVKYEAEHTKAILLESKTINKK